MDEDKSKILVLVEGAKTDVNLMTHLLNVFGIGDRHEIVSYNTNIYTLYHNMFEDGDPESVDLLQSLKEHEHDQEKKRLFDARYSDILLIFDLDPHAPDYSSEKIMEMLAYFVESSDMGKLYINYPMVESFYHMKSIPDDDYNSYTVSLEELRQHKYKQRVNAENRNHDYSKFAVSKEECTTVIQQNIDKAWLLSTTQHLKDAVIPEALGVLVTQLRNIEERQLVSVLCTCVFYIADYNPHFLET